MKMEYYWWKKMIVLPVRRFCQSLASRLAYRNTGILMLRREVKACEYEDVHIMWELLKKTKSPDRVTRSTKLLKVTKSFRNAFAWTRATCLSNKF